MLFFFFKQKTAYEMRISDWSSDVCSSDLLFGRVRKNRRAVLRAHVIALPVQLRGIVDVQENIQNIVIADDVGVKLHPDRLGMAGIAVADLTIGRVCDPAAGITAFHRQHALQIIERSEEHTSELQSLMRSSYAVYCLKKKINNKKH